MLEWLHSKWSHSRRMANILITGATGFVGAALVARLRRDGHNLSGTTRNPDQLSGPGDVPLRVVPDFDGESDFAAALNGAQQVVHLAARVHVMRERAADGLALHRRVNRDATRRLAVQAAEAGVKRLVFVSTVKAMNETSLAGDLNETMASAPVDPYGIAKWEAEQALAEVAAHTGLEVVILRPPMVYGPGVKGNFRTLLGLCRRGLPLPLGAVTARRSMIYVHNLADALAACLARSEAAGETFFVSDGEDVSVAELVRRLARHMDRRPWLARVPPALLRLAGTLAGRRDMVDRLTLPLVVDGARIRSRLDWSAPFTLDEGLAATARWYAESRAP